MSNSISRRRLSLGLASSSMGVGFGFGLGGCKKEPGSEPAPVTAALWIAPVADAHPWVIALVTAISIARPSGSDARLEGLHGHAARLQGHAGRQTPDPIIETEDRAALATYLAGYTAMHPIPPELAPAWEHEPFGPDQRVRGRLFFVDHSRGFVVDGDARARLRQHEHGPSVQVQLGPAQTEALHALSRDCVGHRLAIGIDDEALTLPVVVEPLDGGSVQLLTSPSEDPELTAPALLTRLTGRN